MVGKLIQGGLMLLVLFSSEVWSVDKERVHDTERQQEMLQERLHDKEEDRRALQERERIFGWQLMSPAERMAYRQKMRTLKTHKEREAYRKEHHERMNKRAKEMGVKIEELPE